MSRLSSISDSGGTLATETYLGLSDIVTESYTDPQDPGATPQISLDYTQGGSYAGLDRFGRVLDQLWSQVGRSNPLDEYQYTYDPVGNQTAQNVTDQSPPTAGLLDQSLGYYNCNRLSYNYNPATGKYPDAYAYNSSGNQIMSWAGSAYIPDRAVDAANELYFVAANGDYNQAAAQYDLAGNQISLEQGGDRCRRDREVRRLGPARRGQRRQRPSDRNVHL